MPISEAIQGYAQKLVLVKIVRFYLKHGPKNYGLLKSNRIRTGLERSGKPRGSISTQYHRVNPPWRRFMTKKRKYSRVLYSRVLKFERNSLTSFFLFVGVLMPELSMFDLKFGFYVSNPAQNRLERSRIRNLGANLAKLMLYIRSKFNTRYFFEHFSKK